ncbi:hypothetical protein [Cerasicoccus frondis]|nr:hypothetical protein [Cerasicoccus frondis]
MHIAQIPLSQEGYFHQADKVARIVRSFILQPTERMRIETVRAPFGIQK